MTVEQMRYACLFSLCRLARVRVFLSTYGRLHHNVLDERDPILRKKKKGKCFEVEFTKFPPSQGTHS